jgi:hypothetical protein
LTPKPALDLLRVQSVNAVATFAAMLVVGTAFAYTVVRVSCPALS